jgi:endonuclease/exonuclease/phosphatase family metal-dependent hydrolase
MMVILLIGLPVHIRFISFGSEGDAESNSDHFKITSFNVRGFDTYQWTHPDLESAEKAFLNFIKENNADILCFQEYTLDKRSSKHMLPSEIKAAGDFKYYAKKVTVQTVNLDFGLAIYSKYPIIDQGLVGKENDLYSLFIDVQVKEDTVRIYNTHLQSIRLQQDEYSLFDDNAPSNKDLSQRITGLVSKLKNAYPSRMQQAINIVNHANQCSYPKVVCGDFNEPPTSYIYSVFNDQFYDSYRLLNFGTGRTYAGKIPAGRIDYILLSEKLSPRNFELANGKLLSDHYPISVELSLK